ncbi:MAG: hypothetical protein U5J97_10810 [Trueperaceae bacterium]|nr:hypothetical protein [Trueperaceae bacterium]
MGSALVAIVTAALGIASAELARRGLDRADPDGTARRPLVAVLLALTVVQGARSPRSVWPDGWISPCRCTSWLASRLA